MAICWNILKGLLCMYFQAGSEAASQRAEFKVLCRCSIRWCFGFLVSNQYGNRLKSSICFVFIGGFLQRLHYLGLICTNVGTREGNVQLITPCPKAKQSLNQSVNKRKLSNQSIIRFQSIIRIHCHQKCVTHDLGYSTARHGTCRRTNRAKN